MFRKIKNSIKEGLSINAEEIIISDKVMEIMEIINSHSGTEIRPETKIKIIATVKENIGMILNQEEIELGNKMQEIMIAQSLFNESFYSRIITEKE